MVRTSGIREKFRSNALKELAKRGTKRSKLEPKDEEEEEKDDSEDEEQARLDFERRLLKAKSSQKDSSLLSLLPQPKNSSAFGPTVRLDKLLKMPERADEVTMEERQAQSGAHSDSASRLTEDGMLEVDVSKVIGDVSQTLIKELTVEKAKPTVIVPKGKEKQKNQITYLAQLSKATELERKEQAAQSRINKAAARSKYGW